MEDNKRSYLLHQMRMEGYEPSIGQTMMAGLIYSDINDSELWKDLGN